MDAKALAMLGVLTAVNAALRSLGAGIAGVELVFFLLILAGRVFGPGFGFVLGCTSLFASALLTRGVGPWLPYQMLCSAWIGLVRGPAARARSAAGRARTRRDRDARGLRHRLRLRLRAADEPLVVALHPRRRGARPRGHAGVRPRRAAGGEPAPLPDLHAAHLDGGWDTGRAITNSVAIVVLGPAILATLRRAARRASYGPVEPAIAAGRGAPEIPSRPAERVARW